MWGSISVPDYRNVFISHIHEDDAGLGDVKRLLGGKGFALRDYSINSLKPNNAKNEEYIKREILAPQIRQAGVFMVYITADTHASDWVNWEIDYAMQQGKRIVGVWAPGAKDSELPPALEKYADAIVGWNSDRIIDAIEGRISNWVTADGGERPNRPIKRYGC